MTTKPQKMVAFSQERECCPPPPPRDAKGLVTENPSSHSFIEHRAFPSRYPKLAAKHRESNTAGIDIFSKFSAYIKNTKQQNNAGE